MIRFGLFGHTHKEDFQIANSMSDPEKPILVNSIGGSVTTYQFKNPSFMVIDFDAETMLPVNMRTYFTDLSKATESSEPPVWEVLHDYKETYGMVDLSPSSFKKFAESLKHDTYMASLFKWNEDR